MLKLPDLILLEDYNGEWDKYLEVLYRYFKEDFIDKDIVFDSRKVFNVRNPLVENKEFSFWHLITEGEIEEKRLPDFRRCERIRWPKVILENYNELDVKIWEGERRNKKGKIQRRICLCYGDWEYLVVLSKRRDYYLFCTAYPVSEERRKNKLRKECEEFKSKHRPF